MSLERRRRSRGKTGQLFVTFLSEGVGWIKPRITRICTDTLTANCANLTNARGGKGVFIHELHELTRIVCFSTNIIAALPLGLGATHHDISTRIFKDLESCLNRHIQASRNGIFNRELTRLPATGRNGFCIFFSSIPQFLNLSPRHDFSPPFGGAGGGLKSLNLVSQGCSPTCRVVFHLLMLPEASP